MVMMTVTALIPLTLSPEEEEEYPMPMRSLCHSETY